MPGLISQASMANNTNFQHRVQSAILAEAAIVLASSPTAGYPVTYQLRTALAIAITQNSSPYVVPFAYAIVGYGNGAPGTLSGDMSDAASTVAASSGSPAEITTSAANTFTTGETVLIQGATDTAIDGMWTVTVIDSTHFTVPIASTMTVSTPQGIAQAQPPDSDIATAVSAIWNNVAGITANTL